MKHIAYYVRVSSKQQDTASQLPDLERHAQSQTEPTRFYHDKKTGKTMDRPQWNKLSEAIRQGQVSKVGLVSIRDGLDLGTPPGRLMAGVLASVAQYETEIRSERVQAGQAVALAKGKHWGGSVKGREMATRAAKEQVEQIQRMKREGESIASIARATGLSRPTVYSYLPTN
jgi:DNA invertase Pin-like site-specific DNA recombinase